MDWTSKHAWTSKVLAWARKVLDEGWIGPAAASNQRALTASRLRPAATRKDSPHALTQQAPSSASFNLDRVSAPQARCDIDFRMPATGETPLDVARRAHVQAMLRGDNRVGREWSEGGV
jgi:hypothetical protein